MQRLRLRVLMPMLICWPALTVAAGSTIDQLRLCASEPDDAKRLACYDHEMKHTSSGETQDFGMTPELLRRKQAQAGVAPPAQPQNMSAVVAEVSSQPFGKFVVTLDNGQVWAQQEVLDFDLKAGDTITIKPGVLGVLWMVDARHRAQTRVKRIK